MTENTFRKLALALPGTSEGEHMDHPDFRVGGKIFATLQPRKEWAMVSLSPDEQAEFCSAHPEMFRPVDGGWGRQGATTVILPAAESGVVEKALQAAWTRRAPKKLREP